MFFAFKPLRVALLIAAVFFIFVAPKPDTEALIECPQPKTTQAKPGAVEKTNKESSMFCKEVALTLFVIVLAPLLFFVVLLDLIMCSVQLSAYQGRQRDSYWLAICCSAVAVTNILTAWSPYFFS